MVKKPLNKSLCIFWMPAIVFLLFIPIVFSYPPLSTVFYGNLKVYNNNVSTGTVSAYVNGVWCGDFSVAHSMYYGILSCNADDLETTVIEGGINGLNVTFRYNNLDGSSHGNSLFASGQFKWVNVTIPIIVCGDSFCDSFEGCASCPQDCGQCPGQPPKKPPGGGAVPPGVAPPKECSEEWNCTDWSPCSIYGIQTRFCYDKNGCNATKNKPNETQECEYEPTCFDGIKNGNEDGVDCGGNCVKQCPKELPRVTPTIKLPKFELPKRICERTIDLTNPYLWFFIGVIIITIIARIIYTDEKIKRIKDDSRLSDLERAKKIYALKRRTYLFIAILLSISIILILYFYLFVLCPTEFLDYSWLLILALLLAPLIIHRIMKYFEYSEEEKIEKLERITGTHYEHIKQLIEIENNHLAEIENEISNDLYRLSKDEDFKNIMHNYPEIKKVYKDLMQLYDKYKENKNPFEMEKDLCQELYDLLENKEFVLALEKNKDLKLILEKLKTLYKQYELKQDLYNQMDAIEEEEEKEKKEKKQKISSKKK